MEGWRVNECWDKIGQKRGGGVKMRGGIETCYLLGAFITPSLSICPSFCLYIREPVFTHHIKPVPQSSCTSLSLYFSLSASFSSYLSLSPLHFPLPSSSCLLSFLSSLPVRDSATHPAGEFMSSIIKKVILLENTPHEILISMSVCIP